MSNFTNASLPTPSSNPILDVMTAAVPEPGPDWPVAKQEWGIAWEFHWIGFGSIYALLALNSLIAIIRFQKVPSLARKLQFQAINGLLILLGVSRALYLWIEPYESGENLVYCPLWLVRPLFGIAFPCLTSAFCLLHIAFLEAVKLQLQSEKLRSVRFVSGVIALHFVVVIVADTTVAIHANRTELLIICQSFFIVWGVMNAVAFMYSGSRVIIRDKENMRQLKQSPFQGKLSRQRKNWSTKVGKVTIATSVLALTCTAVQTYSLFGVYGIYSKEVNPQPWPWLGFQTSFRLVELGMACTIAYTVLQPAANRRNGIFDLYSCYTRQNAVNAVLNETRGTKILRLSSKENFPAKSAQLKDLE